MSYTALYRKWRPAKFEDVKGQDAIVKTLKNQILSDRIGHAYLFCGTRGTGKTSVAKIFAKAVNCENPVDGSPCGECSCCKAVAAGNSLNVIEIDAASNNGVDNIREIRDEVAYSPTEGRFKVYIIDEVHMLSGGAFNALLKTLEEPPSYVIFILATTEVHKIPVTILSRCQRYDFKRISVDTITERLHELMEGENIQAEEKALRYIAKSADGALRDALSLFDQCNAFYYGQELTYDLVLDVLGALDTKVFSELLCSIMAKDIKSAIKLLDNVIMMGKELNQFVVDFTWYLRNLLMVKTSDEDEIDEVLDISTENLLQMKREAQAIKQETIMRYIRIFSELSNEIKYSASKRILIEIAIIKLCKPSMETDIESMLDRIRELEEKVEKGVVVNSSVNVEEESVQDDFEPPKLPKALSEDIKTVVNKWNEVVEKLYNPASSFLKNARLSVTEDNRLIIAITNDWNADFLNREDTKPQVEKALNEVAGKEIEYTIVAVESKEEFRRNYPDLSVIKMDIEME